MSKRKLISDWLISQKLTNTQLLSLYTKLGVPKPPDGKKSSLLTNLTLDLASSKLSPPGSVISLDVGVKNMAMARYRWSGTSCILEQCIKLDMNPDQLDFTPSNWSYMAKEFLFDQVLKPIDDDINDVTILVERQRFRTGGGTNVLETTLHANTIESMLFMGVEMWNELLGKKQRRISIESVAPSTMVNFWEGKVSEEITGDGSNNKDLRLKILAQIINDSTPAKYKIGGIPQLISGIPEFKLSSNIIDQIDLKSWEKAWKFKSNSRKLFEVISLINKYSLPKYQIPIEKWGKNKGDDLTDSILYGLHHWEIYQFRVKVIKCINENSDIKVCL